MKSKKAKKAVPVLLAGVLAACLSAAAQQATPSDAQSLAVYSVSRETSLVGTIVKFDAASSVPPIGAHVLLQTPSGQVDVHVGNERLLKANHLSLNAGDSVRIVGEMMTLGGGQFFAARIVQKGAQAVAIRNGKGYLLNGAANLTDQQKAELRGVR
jgi:hypothetical protein